jgi:glycosyltransferase involved in cell wall biosynthesis
MKYNIYLTTYNRPDYLKVYIDSIQKTDLSLVNKIYIFDDCSTDEKVYNLLKEFRKNNEKVEVYKNDRRYGGPGNFCKTMRFALSQDKLIVNTDSDVEFKYEWLLKIDEMLAYCQSNDINPGMITPYNSSVHQKYIELTEQYLSKSATGGLCVLLNKNLLKKLLFPHVPHVWDWKYIELCHEHDFKIITTKRSYINHIGKHSVVAPAHTSKDFALNLVD